ncbi:uncharacterized protein K02A2.6-like [Uranotaenia lowii]|uniref:uncharacterized protein K02A2.6-like n=1 Tax=Uranotaenia lowii TaxID=190385 RepID=UPI0024790DD6|nr:uncharacterized protein K02A2.6-like [Uranotaenia lowii]
MRLQSFRFKVVHIARKINIEDSLSRLPQFKNCTTYDRFGEEAILTVTEQASPVALSVEDVIRHSLTDSLLAALKEAMLTNRWTEELKKFAPFKNEIYSCNETVMRGDRMIIPQSLQKRVLTLAHIGHPGIERSKQRLRSKVWWPSMDKDVKKAVRSCSDCQIVGGTSPPEPMAMRELPENPWETLCMDILGPLPSGKSLLVVEDLYSRFRVV